MSEAEFQKLIETMPRRRRKRRRKAGKVTVTRADGTVEVVKPGAFRRRKKKQKRTSYENYDRLGNERMTDLTTLCRSCHRRLHRG